MQVIKACIFFCPGHNATIQRWLRRFVQLSILHSTMASQVTLSETKGRALPR